jgi:uncharacterized OB-fold protein
MTEPMIYHQAIKLPYRYTAGEANTAFLNGLVEQKILAGKCGSCDITVAPLTPFCTQCGTRLEDPVEVGPAGTVTTWTIDGSGRTFARIRLDGADTDILHRVDGEVSIGTRVEPVWAEERGPEITAITTFTPA